MRLCSISKSNSSLLFGPEGSDHVASCPDLEEEDKEQKK